jgi:hypothetical protein
VEIVLADPQTDLIEANAGVRLKLGKRSVDAAGQLVQSPAGRRLTVRAPRDQFVNGIWSMSVQTEADRFVPLAARLLWRATGRSTSSGERPRAGPCCPPRPRRSSDAEAACRGGWRPRPDSVLAVLPDERASTVRKRAREAARRVLS